MQKWKRQEVEDDDDDDGDNDENATGGSRTRKQIVYPTVWLYVAQYGSEIENVRVQLIQMKANSS